MDYHMNIKEVSATMQGAIGKREQQLSQNLWIGINTSHNMEYDFLDRAQ